MRDDDMVGVRENAWRRSDHYRPHRLKLLQCNKSDPAFLLIKSYFSMWKLRAARMLKSREIDHLVVISHSPHKKTTS